MKTLTEIFNEENAANGITTTAPSAHAQRQAVPVLKTLAARKIALADATLPKRIKIFNAGENPSIDGTFRVGQKTADMLPITQKLGFERVAIDYDHCSVAGTVTNKELMKNGQPPLIFGYGQVNLIPGDGIYLENITWTPLGIQCAKNFEDISPTVGSDDNGEVTFIHSVALTPNGKLSNLESFHSQLARLSALSASHPAIGQRRQVDLAEIYNRENLAATAALSASRQPEHEYDRWLRSIGKFPGK